MWERYYSPRSNCHGCVWTHDFFSSPKRASISMQLIFKCFTFATAIRTYFKALPRKSRRARSYNSSTRNEHKKSEVEKTWKIQASFCSWKQSIFDRLYRSCCSHQQSACAKIKSREKFVEGWDLHKKWIRKQSKTKRNEISASKCGLSVFLYHAAQLGKHKRWK